MESKIIAALDHCGYYCEPSVENLIICFLDYVDAGSFGNLDLEEAQQMMDDGELTVDVMCSNLMKTK